MYTLWNYTLLCLFHSLLHQLLIQIHITMIQHSFHPISYCPPHSLKCNSNSNRALEFDLLIHTSNSISIMLLDNSNKEPNAIHSIVLRLDPINNFPVYMITQCLIIHKLWKNSSSCIYHLLYQLPRLIPYFQLTNMAHWLQVRNKSLMLSNIE